jgi:hypothetical protein
VLSVISSRITIDAVRAVLVIAAIAFVCSIVVLFAYFKILHEGDCKQPEHHRIERLRGQVVGRSLGLVQYRWLRRRFIAAGTKLRLIGPRKDPVGWESLLIDRVVNESGTFDFGNLPAGDYSLEVTLPGEATFGVSLTIDSTAHNNDILIDASPRYYCSCCGWDFEPR